MSKLSVNHLLGIKYITREDIDLILSTADHFKDVINRPIKKVPSLRDITIANLFFENSTRSSKIFFLNKNSEIHRKPFQEHTTTPPNSS